MLILEVISKLIDYIYGKNEYDCLTRLVEGIPYSFKQLIDTKK